MVTVDVVSMESFVLRFFGKRRPINITTSPVLMDLNTFMASSCFIPCNDFPFTTRISSPVVERKKWTRKKIVRKMVENELKARKKLKEKKLEKYWKKRKNEKKSKKVRKNM